MAEPSAPRFGQLYRSNHPSLSLGTLLAWPEVEAWAEAALVVAMAVGVALGFTDPTGSHHRRYGWIPR